VNVNKGSRQIKPVTLGKRLALMIEHQVTPRCLSTVKGDSSRLVYEVTLGKPPWSELDSICLELMWTIQTDCG